MQNRIWLYAEGIEGLPHYLSALGTISDLRKMGVELKEGLTLPFYNHDSDENGKADPLLFEGVVHFDGSKNQWYAILDDKSFRHSSDKNE